jgi:hypothetical protein
LHRTRMKRSPLRATLIVCAPFDDDGSATAVAE